MGKANIMRTASSVLATLCIVFAMSSCAKVRVTPTIDSGNESSKNEVFFNKTISTSVSSEMLDQGITNAAVLLQDGHGNSGTGIILYNEIVIGKNTFLIPYLVTAKHVLQSLEGDYIRILYGLEKQSQRIPHHRGYRIRYHGKPMWVEHESADVAAIQLAFFESEQALMQPVETTLLADIASLKELHVAPGDSINVVAYVHGASIDEWGSPVVRGGTIASHPISKTALKQNDTFTIDYNANHCNSGGLVVYNKILYSRFPFNSPSKIQILLGILAKKHLAEYKNNKAIRRDLNITSVTSTKSIRETIKKLESDPLNMKHPRISKNMALPLSVSDNLNDFYKKYFWEDCDHCLPNAEQFKFLDKNVPLPNPWKFVAEDIASTEPTPLTAFEFVSKNPNAKMMHYSTIVDAQKGAITGSAIIPASFKLNAAPYYIWTTDGQNKPSEKVRLDLRNHEHILVWVP